MRLSILSVENNYEKVFTNSAIYVDQVENLKEIWYFNDIRFYDAMILEDWIEEISSNFIREMKEKNRKMKIIILSKNPNLELDYLKLGVDDFLLYSDNTEILKQKVINILGIGSNSIINYGDFVLDAFEKTLKYQTHLINLKGKPFEVFLYMVLNQGKIISKEEFLDAIWEEPELVTPSVVDMSISKIRKIIDNPFNITTVETVRRRGYRLEKK